MLSTLNPARALGAAMILALAQPSLAHSWVEQLRRIAPNGTMVGEPGFVRGFTPRSDPSWSDTLINYLVPPNDGRPIDEGIRASDKLCHPSQKMGSYTKDFPKLDAAPGDFVALRYQENGHVSLPGINPTKPLNGGTIYVYGTAEATDDMKLLDVFGKWTADGQGGDKKGRLLATRNYDDGKCYQVNGDNISKNRQAKFAKTAEAPQGADLWCQSDIQLPDDVEVGKDYTLFWVWSWPTMNVAGAPNDIPGQKTKDGRVTKVDKEEVYTSCMEASIVAASSGDGSDDGSKGGKGGKGGKKGLKAAAIAAVTNSFKKDQDLNNAAILDQLTDNNFAVDVGDGSGAQGRPGSGSGADSGSDSGSDGDKPAPQPSQSSKCDGGGIKTVTVTASAATETVTVTKGGADQAKQTQEPSRAAGNAAVPPSPTAVAPFLTPKRRTARRTAGEWGFGY